MPAISQDITLYKGDTLKITVPVRDASSAVVNLSGAGVTWWMGKNVSSTGTDVYIKKSLGSGVSLTSDTAGLYTITVDVDPTDSQSLSAGTFYHEVAVIDADGNIGRVAIGKFMLKPTLIPDSELSAP